MLATTAWPVSRRWSDRAQVPLCGQTGLMQMRHDPSLWRRRRYIRRAAVQRNLPKADVHAGLNVIDRNPSFAADAPQVRVADEAADRGERPSDRFQTYRYDAQLTARCVFFARKLIRRNFCQFIEMFCKPRCSECHEAANLRPLVRSRAGQ